MTPPWKTVADWLRGAWREPSGERWHTCLFWTFWLSLASFPIGYGAREVLPPLAFLFLLLYYRANWQGSVLRRLDARWLFACLGGMVVIGIAFSGDPWASLLHAGTGCNKGFILPFIAMECVRDGKSLRRLVWACVLACFWQGLDGMYQAATGRDIVFGYPLNARRLTGSLGDYSVGNYIALALIPAFGLWHMLRERHAFLPSALVWSAALAPGFFLLIGAASRSGALAVAAAPCLWALLCARKRRPLHILAVLAAAAAILLALLWLEGRASAGDVLRDGRWSLWRLGWRVFLEHPWLGAGAGRYNAAFRDLGLTPDRDAITISHPHDLFLDMLYAHGLVGFTLGMVFLLGFALWGWRRIRPRLRAEQDAGRTRPYWRLAAWFWVGYVCWFVNGIFGHDFYRMWWLALAMSHMGVMIGAVVSGMEDGDHALAPPP